MTDVSSLDAIKDVAVICASITGIYVALSGLHTWKKQVIGTDQIKTIRNAISCLLIYRENIRRIRDINSTMRDIQHPTKEDRDKFTGQQNYFKGLSVSYESRLLELSRSRANLESALVEVEVVSSPVLKSTMAELFRYDEELRTTVSAFLSWSNPDLPQMMITAAWNVLEPRFDIVNSQDQIDDEFASSVNVAVHKVLRELRYKLKIAG